MIEFKIQNRLVGDGHPLFYIAEAGVNHNGSVKLAKQLVDVAVDAGADAVKFQTFKTEKIITPKAPKSKYIVDTTGSDDKQSWFDLLKTQEMSKEMHIEVIDYCNKQDIIFLSTPYDEESVDLLIELDIPAFKIASTDTSNIPFLKSVAKKGVPMIISTAMATMEEVHEAVSTVMNQGLDKFALLQCTGNYPSKLSDSNLRVMNTYRKEFDCITGYSDHTPDLINPIAATAMGAKIYEKHFTIDKKLPGPDHRMSINPFELKQTIQAIRRTEMALGSSKKKVLKDEEENRLKLRKSIVANTDICKNEIIISEMVAIMRPGTGIKPGDINNILGKKARLDISKGTVLSYSMIDNE